ncbi:hydroxymethylbilane synthase [Natronosalvus rutilus]|uniref:Hydroxymethylbilane synthase n=1 Tax=Natronosalvus rutilus TaxID=2953753 RepID=A0A9E7NEZ3_9EURY|nr:hydroxymethylbilane synthase [Natronosalvus rutilus]UTF55537.1 hydroxymethylbilane synthase [Natronosalvus rutilus]
MRTKGTVTLATRGSTLARRQADLVGEALENRRYDVAFETVETTGDQLRDELIHRLGKTGAFVRELDEHVLEGSADGAVHSMKDMPTEQPGDLVTAAVPERARPGDVLVTPDGTSLEDLPEGAVVGTSSLRRRAQLLAERPDLEVEPIRGNVDTRLEKVLAPALQAEREERREADSERKGNAGSDGGGYKPSYDDGDADDENGDEADEITTVDDWHATLSDLEQRALERDVDVAYDALVLAEAGLERSGLNEYVEYQRLSPQTFVPAPGQGALAVTAVDGETARELNEVLAHPRTRVETTVERSILAELGGGCIAPVGIYAVLQGEYVHANVQVFDEDGQKSVTGSRDLPVERHAAAARQFARDLAERGAAELIEAARETEDEEAEVGAADVQTEEGRDD